MSKTYLFFSSCLLALVFTAFFTGAANAAIFTVTKTTDSNDGICDSDCSLREAVIESNAAYSNDIIIFSPSLIGGTVTVAAAPIEIAGKGDLTVEGPGAGLLTISGGNETPIFVIRNPRIGNPMNIRFAGMKMTGGKAWFSPGGAAISSPFGANVEIDRVFFTGNVSDPGVSGGAVYLKNGVHRISNSTFTNNSAFSGGAVWCSGNVTIVNSTFNSNNANMGGALDVSGILKMRNVTIFANTAGLAASMRINSSATVNTGNSLLGAGFATVIHPNIQLEGGATLTSAGNNVIQNTDTLGNVVWQGSDTVNGNLQLSPGMADNGGGMPTFLPQTGNILIDTGSNALADEEGLAIDQRGYYRVAGGHIDRGAVETGSSPAMVMIAGRILNLGRPVPQARVTLTDMSGIVRKYTANPGGYYFSIVPAGAGYFVDAIAAPYTFSPRLVNANRELTGIDLAAQ